MTSVKRSGKKDSLGLGILRVVGRDRFIEFTLDDSLPLSEVESGLKSYLGKFGEKFAGGGVTLNLGNRALKIEHVKSLKGILENEYSLTLAGIFFGADTLGDLLSDKLIVQADSSNDTKSEAKPDTRTMPAKEPSAKGETVASQWQETLMIKGTCRSGTTIHNAGNLVIVGDVNPGAEISATKDVLVFGRLAGMAHAGANGSTESVIVSLNFEAPQLRIGHYIRMDPPVRSRNRSTWTPEMAVVRDGVIKVEPFAPRSLWK